MAGSTAIVDPVSASTAKEMGGAEKTMTTSQRVRKGLTLLTSLLLVGAQPEAYSGDVVDFGSPLTITNGYNVVDKSVIGSTLGPTTQLSVDFTGDTGIWLAMDASFAQFDERMYFTLENNTGAAVDNLSVGFIKQDGTPFHATPDYFSWYTAVSEVWGQVDVDWTGLALNEGDNFARLDVPFDSPTGWAQGATVTFRLNWDFFHWPVRTGWLLNIDLNELDLNDPTVETAYITPIPGAFWLFGSSLLGLFAVRRCRNA